MLASRIAVGLAIVLASCLAFYGLSEASRYRGLLKDQIALTDAAEKRTKAIQSTLRTVSSNYATSEQRLRVVLAQTPDRPTAGPVYNELCRRGNCSKLDPVQTPAD